MRACAEASCAAQAPNSCANVSGIASIRWVRPVLVTLRQRLAARARWSCAGASAPAAGASTAASCAETWIAVGITSLELWPRLTWSLGWILRPCRRARPAWRSPRWRSCCSTCPSRSGRRRSGTARRARPAATFSAAARIASAAPLPSRPKPPLTSAAAALIRPSARMNSRGIGWPEIGKFSTARWVCAPHSASAGTCSSPMLSCSVRKSLADWRVWSPWRSPRSDRLAAAYAAAAAHSRFHRRALSHGRPPAGGQRPARQARDRAGS